MLVTVEQQAALKARKVQTAAELAASVQLPWRVCYTEANDVRVAQPFCFNSDTNESRWIVG